MSKSMNLWVRRSAGGHLLQGESVGDTGLLLGCFTFRATRFSLGLGIGGNIMVPSPGKN